MIHRTRLRTFVLLSLLAPATLFLSSVSRAADPTPKEAPEAPAAQKQAEVPVKGVVLFSSGVGYFEHFGTVTGDGSTELRFKTEQINDVLKSLVLQDIDGGRAGTVSYPSQEPVARTLKSFQVDITSNPTLPELLNQLRGARLTVAVSDVQPGADKSMTGVIVGVEKRKRTVGEKQVEEYDVLTLKIDRKVRTVPLESVSEMSFEDAALDAELDKALAALAESRDKDKKPVTINFRGKGDRRVRIGYVIETPIWKTSYRLILSDDHNAKNDDAVKQDVDKNAPPAKGTEPGRAAPNRGPDNGIGKLQGWAIVENQTDNDWNDVQLSLVSGRPISFIQDLYHPLYIPRPIVQPELYASLRPQTYAGGMTQEALAKMEEARAQQSDFDNAPDASLEATKTGKFERNRGWRDSGGGGGGGGGLFANAGGAERPQEAMDPSASVQSVASGGKLGELFQYTVGNVSIKRQRSAMIPIVTEDIDVQKLSIFNEAVLPTHPLNGARLKNTTKNHLLQGPITVIEAGSYAGDARVDDVPPGQDRLISYGVDLQTLVDAQGLPADKEAGNGTVLSASISKGVLLLQVKRIDGRRYVISNKSDVAKTVVIEHPKTDWKLVEPAKAEEVADQWYRFNRKVEPGAMLGFNVKTEVIDVQQVAILNSNLPSLLTYTQEGTISKEVKAALAKAIELRNAQVSFQRQIQTLNARIKSISEEQQRIRDNIKTVSPDSDYGKRLIKKLNEQESSIEKLQAELDALRESALKSQEELETYLKELNVE